MPNFASIQPCSVVELPPNGMIARSDSANSGGAAVATPLGSTVTATRFAGPVWSPMNHLLSQYAGHATPLFTSTFSRW